MPNMGMANQTLRLLVENQNKLPTGLRDEFVFERRSHRQQLREERSK